MKAASADAGARASDRRRRGSATLSLSGRRIGRIGLLVVIDTTEASKRVLQYIGRILAGRDRVDIHLAFITSGLPPELLESGGSELPEREEQIESDMRGAQRHWTAVADKRAERILRPARATLQRAGVAAARIQTCVSSPLDARTAVDEVLLLARDQRCGTVVVGHHAHTWFRGLGGGHLAEQLVRSAQGLAVANREETTMPTKKTPSFKTIPVGTPVSWHYRSAIGHGTVTGVHRRGTTTANTMYSIKEHDHHPGEPAVVFHSGKALTRTAKQKTSSSRSSRKTT